MPILDSVGKIITRYFACVCAESFTYKSKVYKPKSLILSPLLFRDFTCPVGCGGCCPSHTLDYLPSHLEEHPYTLDKRFIHFNGRRVCVYSDLNLDHGDYFCRNLNKVDGRCNIHKRNPFSCDFELTRFLQFADPKHPNRLLTKLYGRGHALKRIDGNRGALCEMLPPSTKSTADIVRKLNRLKVWCDHFKLKNKLDRMIDYAEKGPRLDSISV